MIRDEYLFGTIREIDASKLPKDIVAAVAKDTDDDHALCIYCKKRGIGGHFNISWLEDKPDTVDWLAWVIGNRMQESYDQGVSDKEKEIVSNLSGFTSILKKLLK